jgi:hypothetical protein
MQMISDTEVHAGASTYTKLSLKGRFLPPGTESQIHLEKATEQGCLEEMHKLVQFYFICLKPKFFLVENVKENGCGLGNSTTVLICSMQGLFTRNVR